MVTIRDVSNYCNVSVATVSRVLNNPEKVAADTRERVLDAIKQLDFRPNEMARNLVGGETGLIGVVVNTIGKEYFSRLTAGIDAAVFEAGFRGVTMTNNQTVEMTVRAVHMLASLRCQALVIHCNIISDEELTTLMTRTPSLILLCRKLKGFEDRCIYIDNEAAGRTVAEHLFAKGHRVVAQIGGPQSHIDSVARQQGFADYFAEMGAPVAPGPDFHGDFSEEAGAKGMKAVLEARPDVTAVFCHDDHIAWGAIDHCRANGIHVPDDISIVGFNDLERSRYMTPRLTTLRQPLWQFGYAAGKLAIAFATGASDEARGEFSGEQVYVLDERDTVRAI